MTSRPAFFAIQETDTTYRKWLNEDTLLFDWSKVTSNLNGKLPDQLIEVSQHLNGHDHSEIKKVANDVFQTASLEVYDPLFAVRNQTIEKVGFINRKLNTPENQVSLDITWISVNELGAVKGSIFKADSEIQVLRKADLKKIERQYETLFPAIEDRLPMRNLFGEERYGRTEFKQTEKNMEFLEKLSPKIDQGEIVKLFYGTNRELISPYDQPARYGTDSAALQFGYCEVGIPVGHVQGELERPGKILMIELPENDKRHIVVKKVTPMAEGSFKEAFIKELDLNPQEHALVFIHGYNNSFEDAARRAAQLAHDLPFSGPAGFFSWPSSAKAPDYFADEAKARSAAPAFKKFLQTILEDTPIKKLHLIAHSMGSLVLTLSVNAMSRDVQSAGLLSVINQIILAAPDIDQEEFRTTILPEFQGIGTRRTIYASDHDGPLGVSSFLRRKRRRLGQTGTDIFLDKSLDTVEASNIPTESSHSYMF